jgi:hypothetical protein
LDLISYRKQYPSFFRIVLNIKKPCKSKARYYSGKK